MRRITGCRHALLGLTLAVICSLAWGNAAYAKGFTLKAKDVEIRDVFQMIARQGKFNLLLDKSIRGKVPVELKDVPHEKALELLAKINKLKVKKIKDLENTFVIAPQDVIERGFEQGLTNTYTLRFAKAQDMATILSKALGKSANVNVETDERTNSVVVNGTEDVLAKVRALILNLDRPVPQVLIDAKIVNVTSSVVKDLGFQWDWNAGSSDGAVENNGQGTIWTIGEYERRNLNADGYANAPVGVTPMKFGDFYRGTYFFDSVFRALETNELTRTLASPRLLAVNGAKAQLRIGDKIIFSGGPSQPPEERDTGIVMDITPRINSDNFITMDISLSESNARFRDSDYPTISQTNAKTTVQVRDGEEVLIGGLVQEVHRDTQEKIPFLGDIPLLKHFFRRNRSNPETRELVILVTPRVIRQQIPGYDLGEKPGIGGPPKAGPAMGDDLPLDDLFDGGGKKPVTGGTKPAGGGKPTGGGKKPPDSFDDLDDLDDLDDFK